MPHHRLLFEQTRDLVLFIERESGRIIEANPAAARAYGYSREELLNLSIRDLRAPDTIGVMAEQMMHADGNGILFETFHLRKDGTIFPVEVNSRGATINGVRTIISAIRDITERKQTEEALKASESAYRTMFENTVDVFYRVDCQGIIREISPSCAKYSGYTREELIGKPILSFYDNPEDSKAFWSAVREKGEVTDFGIAVRSKSGSLFYVSTSARVVHGSTPMETGIEGTLRDITPRKLMEKALEEKEALLRATLDATADGILVVDENGRITHKNARFSTLWRIPQTMLSTADDEVLLQYVLDQLEEPEAFLAKVKALYGTSDESLDTVAFKDGRFFERYSCPLLKEEKVCGRVWSFRDITERKQQEKALRESETKYRRIFESLEDVYYQTDNEGRIRILSPSLRRMAGWDPEELIGRPATDICVEPPDRESLFSILARNGFVRDYDVLLKRKDGTSVTASLSGQLLYDDGGRPDGTSGVLRDITDRKIAEEALQYETAFLDAVISCSQEGIYLLDAGREEVLVNRRARDLWHMPEEVDDFEGIGLHMIRSLQDAVPFAEKLAYLLAHPNESVRLELELKDGTALDGLSSPISKAGKNYGRLWTFRDITEPRRHARMLESLSGTDALTSLANRRRFDEVLAREWQRAIRNQSSLALVMIDIDFFKGYNDCYGHPAGDDCLRQVASAIASTVQRPSDLSARYGGEEFACILPDTDLGGATTVGVNVLGAVWGLHIPHLSSGVADRVTVSIGVSVSVPSDGEPISKLVEHADKSLYQAKLGGRNQVRGSIGKSEEPVMISIQPAER